MYKVQHNKSIQRNEMLYLLYKVQNNKSIKRNGMCRRIYSNLSFLWKVTI